MLRSASPSSSPRWRWPRTTRSASRSSRNCARACSRRGSARRQDSTARCARTPIGWRCCGTSAAPVMPTRSPPCSATRSRFAPRRSSTTPPIRPRSWATWSPSRRPGAPRTSATRSSACSRRRPTSGRCTTSPPAARSPTCSCNGSTSPPACEKRSRTRSSAGTARASRPTRRARRSRSRCASCTSATTWRRSAGSSPPDRALDAARERRDRTYDPALADLFVEHGRGWFDRLRRDRAVGRRPGPRARAAPDAGRRRPRPGPGGRRRLHRPQVAVHGRPQPPLRTARHRRGPGARTAGGGDHGAPPGGARARLRRHGGPQLDLGQAGPAHTHGVRPRRAPHDADRADASPLAGALRPELRSRPPITRSATDPATTSARGPTPAIRRRACWRPPRSTWG